MTLFTIKPGIRYIRKSMMEFLEDMYDDFYDGILDDAYDNAKYSSGQICVQMNINGGHIPALIFMMTGPIFALKYMIFWDDTKSDIWDSDIAKATENLNDFAKKILKNIFLEFRIFKKGTYHQVGALRLYYLLLDEVQFMPRFEEVLNSLLRIPTLTCM